MKKYNIKNYVRWKNDVKLSIEQVKIKRFIDYTPTELKKEKDLLNIENEKI